MNIKFIKNNNYGDIIGHPKFIVVYSIIQLFKVLNIIKYKVGNQV